MFQVYSKVIQVYMFFFFFGCTRFLLLRELFSSLQRAGATL